MGNTDDNCIEESNKAGTMSKIDENKEKKQLVRYNPQTKQICFESLGCLTLSAKGRIIMIKESNPKDKNQQWNFVGEVTMTRTSGTSKPTGSKTTKRRRKGKKGKK